MLIRFPHGKSGGLGAFAAFCIWLAAAPVAPAQTSAPSPAPSATPSSTPAATLAKPAATPDASLTASVTVPLDQLMAPGPLPDIVQGSPSAPITVVEYASMTCPHCAAFHEAGWKDLKAKYVDSGKVKFVLREFPLDPLATAGFMLARCAGPDKRNAVIDQLYTQQKTWAFVDKPIEPLLELMKGMGFTQADFETCLKNQELYDQVNAERDTSAEAFNIDATPTFFINGVKKVGELTIADFDAAIEPLLK